MLRRDQLDGQFDRAGHAARVGGVLARDVERRAVVGAGADDGQAHRHVHSPIASEELDRNQALVVVHGDDEVVLAASGVEEEGVGGEGAGGGDASGLGGLDGGEDDAVILVADAQDGRPAGVLGWLPLIAGVTFSGFLGGRLIITSALVIIRTLLPVRVEVCGDFVRVRMVLNLGLLRTDARVAREMLRGVALSPCQGGGKSLWLIYRSGVALWAAADVPPEKARRFGAQLARWIGVLL